MLREAPWLLEIDRSPIKYHDFKIKNEAGIHIASMNNRRIEREEDAAFILRAVNLLGMLEKSFPGLVDLKSEVNGGDLVDAITQELAKIEEELCTD